MADTNLLFSQEDHMRKVREGSNLDSKSPQVSLKQPQHVENTQPTPQRSG
jgi:hypothetical protein